jgi:hypothetical protein
LATEREKVGDRIRDGKKKKRRKKFAVAYISRWKVERGCEICGYSRCAQALDFHHLDSSKKDYAPTRLSYKSLVRFHEEIKKCVLLCKNCHVEVHAGCVDGYKESSHEKVIDIKPKQMLLL